MSGPKVVRIVSREEVIAVCEGQLRLLEEGLARWEAAATRDGLATDAEIEAMRGRRDRIRDMLPADRFLDLQKSVPLELDHLEADLEERIDKAVETRIRAQETQQQQKATAARLLASLEAMAADLDPETGMGPGTGTETVLPAELRDGLAALAAGQGLDRADAVLARAYERIAARRATAEAADIKLTEEQQALVAALREGVSATAFVAPPVMDAAAERVAAALVRLALTISGEARAAHAPALARFEAETDAARRRMLADSLILALSQEMARYRQLDRLKIRLTVLAEELEALSDARVPDVQAPDVQGMLTAAEGSVEPAVLEKALAVGEARLAERRSARAAASRRTSLLEALSRQGYALQTGMETALVENGRLVVRKASDPGYGVEISDGSGTAERLQVRVVAFREAGDPGDRAQDLDREQAWCGEVQGITRDMQDTGGDLVIERALAVAATPLKRVPPESAPKMAADRTRRMSVPKREQKQKRKAKAESRKRPR